LSLEVKYPPEIVEYLAEVDRQSTVVQFKLRDVPGEGSLPRCKCGSADLTDALSSIEADVADLEFFLLPGVSFSVGSPTYTHCPLGSVRHRNRVIGVLVPRLPNPPHHRPVFSFLLTGI
jgi:hypothetical protein